MDHDRRRTLAILGGGVAVGFIGPAFLGCSPPSDATKETRPNLPFPYVKLDPDQVGEAGYKNFYVGDCMYGVLATIVDALADEVGDPFRSFPTDVTRFGAGGSARQLPVRLYATSRSRSGVMPPGTRRFRRNEPIVARSWLGQCRSIRSRFSTHRSMVDSKPCIHFPRPCKLVVAVMLEEERSRIRAG